MVAGTIDPTFPPRKSPRVKVQSKTDQKVQCTGIFVDQIWLQSFKFNRLIIRIQRQTFDHVYLVAPLAHCCEEARYVLRADGKLP